MSERLIDTTLTTYEILGHLILVCDCREMSSNPEDNRETSYASRRSPPLRNQHRCRANCIERGRKGETDYGYVHRLIKPKEVCEPVPAILVGIERVVARNVKRTILRGQSII